MDMPMDVFRALIADTISTMSVEELRNVILKTPDKELGAVGAAVLAEKGKKIAMGVAPTVVVGTVKKKSGAKTLKNTSGKETPTAVRSPSKRKHDAIDLTLDTPEKITEGGEANKGDGRASGRENEVIANPRKPKEGVESFAERMMKRVTKVMEGMDWTKVKCRADMIKSIFEGERKTPGGSQVLAVNNIQGMTRFIDQNHAKLQSDPKFAAFYQLTGSTSETNTHPLVTELQALDSSTHPLPVSGSATSTRQDRLPPFDWAAQIKQLKALDENPNDLAKHEIYHAINQMVCSYYQDIIDRCNKGYTNNFPELVQDIHNMSMLAINVSDAPSRELKRRLSSGEPLSQLRDCMSALCTAITRNKSSIASQLDKNERLDIRVHLFNVDSILITKGKSGFNSGFHRVVHHFEYKQYHEVEG